MTDHWYLTPSKPINDIDLEAARAHQAQLTKPPGSLGMLEDIAVSFCAWQATTQPSCEHIQIAVFAADHGVCAQGVSAFPQQVTAQMVANFLSGGAAISVLAKRLGARFTVANLGLVSKLEDQAGLINSPLMCGTNDFTQHAAMSEDTMMQALQIGRESVDNKTQLFIGGDMGIGNTTSASAIFSVLLDLTPEQTVGPGTGVDERGLSTKKTVICQALNRHKDKLSQPIAVLQRLGGLEIAALVGSYIACAQAGIPILVDGFITTAAALLASKINPSSRDWMLFAHKSAEPAHQLTLEHLGAKPLLDLSMRLGEGSGAAIATPIIINALALHSQMATFAEAGVSEE